MFSLGCKAGPSSRMFFFFLLEKDTLAITSLHCTCSETRVCVCVYIIKMNDEAHVCAAETGCDEARRHTRRYMYV